MSMMAENQNSTLDVSIDLKKWYWKIYYNGQIAWEFCNKMFA